MVARQEVDRVATITCTYGTDVVTIDVRLLLHIVDCGEIVAHVLAAIVTADLSIPLGAEARQAAAVGQNHDVAVAGHDAHVPAVTPELADW